ncbi:ABC transporter ATP-binding protein [uncultured Robinsoniella sp.]|uniref:ABC transporter ATP-binding protein n=1 Tax=uncultured Robinsoniella sp. TaxID=904190 RepID=UPI00374F1722
MIEIRDLEIKYGDFTAVKELNIEIKEGEFFTFLGPSGCGKTTTLRCISGFEKASRGQIVVSGRDISGMLPEERNLGFVFQSYALFPSMNVYENIAFGLKAHKVNKQVIQTKVKSVAERTGITEHLHKKVSDLSGGQQQRIAIARALVLEPRILLMDEPLSNLDAKLRITMREEVKRLQKELGITTIYVTHDQEEALAISDRIAVFNLGCLEQVGTPREIYHSPASEFVARFVGEINLLEGKIGTAFKERYELDPVCSCYIRPQKLILCKKSSLEEEKGFFCYPARVDSFEFQGAYSKVNLLLEDGKRISSLVFADEDLYKIGEEVSILFKKSEVIVFGGSVHEQ